MSPAADFDNLLGAVERVVDGGGVGLHVALVAAQELPGAVVGVARRVAEQHVVAVRDEDPEVPAAALLLGLHEDASRVGGDAVRVERVLGHGRDDVAQDLGAGADPAAERRAGQMDPVPLEDLLLPVQRQVVCVLVDEHVGEQPWPREAARDWVLGQLGDGDASLGLAALRVLGPHDLHAYPARGPPFDGRRDLFTDAYVLGSVFAERLGRKDLDPLDGQMLRWDLPSVGSDLARLMTFAAPRSAPGGGVALR
jgi:hypothetical protein